VSRRQKNENYEKKQKRKEKEKKERNLLRWREIFSVLERIFNQQLSTMNG